MNFSRQALLGIGMIIGGSVMLYAMVQQIGASDERETPAAIVEKPSTEQASTSPLTTDIDTEKRILAQKQKERAARVAEQEKRAQEFLAEQESAAAKALAKARAENQQYITNATPAEVAQKTTVATPSLQKREDVEKTQQITEDTEKLIEAADSAIEEAKSEKPTDAKKKSDADAKKQAEAEAKKQAQADAKKKAEEQAAAKQSPPTSPIDYDVKRGDGLLRLARQYNVPVEALAQANDLSPSDSLQLGQTLSIPSRKQIQRLEREAAAAQQAREEKRKREEALARKSVDAKREAQQKLREARQEVKETDAKGSFGVQVALASNQASADEVVKRFKAAGYEVKTSATSRGIRIVVGPERGKVAALALKDKVNSDPQVDTTNAWVLYWR